MGLSRITKYAPDTGRAITSWHQSAACRSIDRQEIFFPHRKDQATYGATAALPYCNACPVILECLQAALVGNEYGTWGGMTHQERLALKGRLKSSDYETTDALRQTLEVKLPRCEDCGNHRKAKEEGRCTECFRVLQKSRAAEEAAHAKAECSLPDCSGKPHAKGKCRKHYMVDRRAMKKAAA